MKQKIDLFSTGGGCYTLITKINKYWYSFNNDYKPIVSGLVYRNKKDAYSFEDEKVLTYISDDESKSLIISLLDKLNDEEKKEVKRLFL